MSTTTDSSGPKRTSTAPRWLGAVRRLERAIGVPVERALTSDTYFDMLPLLRRSRAQLETFVVTMTDDWYRLLNLPTGSEVRQMREQLSRMERQLERLTKQLAERDTATRPRKRDENA